MSNWSRRTEGACRAESTVRCSGSVNGTNALHRPVESAMPSGHSDPTWTISICHVTDVRLPPTLHFSLSPTTNFECAEARRQTMVNNALKRTISNWNASKMQRRDRCREESAYGSPGGEVANRATQDGVPKVEFGDKESRFVLADTRFSPTSLVSASLTTVALMSKRSDRAPGARRWPGSYFITSTSRDSGSIHIAATLMAHTTTT